MAEKVGQGLAKGWRRVGKGLARGWPRVGKGLADFLAPQSGDRKRVVSKRVVLADVPPERKPERGHVRQNHPFTKPPFYLPVTQEGPEKWCRAKFVEKCRKTFEGF